MQKWRSLVQAAKYQIYISRSNNPFLNLSIEHYLLQKSSPESTILFLYINRPCVVIGRNQNPWLEVDLDLKRGRIPEDSAHGLGNVDLVRRRSGGGAVFHDEGNVNYSVICPPAAFTRDKHAEMVTKAIRTFNDRARVNERHDIVVDGGVPLPPSEAPIESDMHRTKYKAPLQPRKISGSAYKLIRNRSLHHGTCLMASPNLSSIGQYLRSPARPFMKARGVESVPSPVANASEYEIGSLVKGVVLDSAYYTDRFQYQVVKAFSDLYGLDDRPLESLIPLGRIADTVGNDALRDENCWAAGFVGEETKSIDEVGEGLEELKSLKWIYGQTPQFTLSSHPIEEDDRKRPSSQLTKLLPSARVYLKARGGAITETNISLSSGADASAQQIEKHFFDLALKGKDINEIRDFRATLANDNAIDSEEASSVMDWLNRMFGKLV